MHINGLLYMPDDKVERFRSWQNDIAIQYSAIDLTNGPGTKYEYNTGGTDPVVKRQINILSSDAHYTSVNFQQQSRMAVKNSERLQSVFILDRPL